MKLNKSTLILGAAVAGLMGVGLTAAPAYAKAPVGLCKGANSCAGLSACGALKGKNHCSGKGFAKMTKRECEHHHGMWVSMRAMRHKMMMMKKHGA